MGRWQPDARSRLTQAGLALFEERGYDATTVADIAAAAGLTERTFFRHFSDKREVLFDGSVALAQAMVEAVEDAPPEASPQEAVRAGLGASAAFFADRRAHAGRRQAVLADNPVLLERELMKLATLTDALRGALRVRGVDEATATLAAEVGVLVFRVGFTRWLEEDRPLTELFDETYAAVQAATTGA
ncbi:TetR/AcrR family transcriptional regulator [Microlunatus flavus]|uniref:DNA-binding transcriptional regulator, AcrR family n=1 Tax=Microlunatus flavus TaxID=1036181 RepID=A0A1H8ZG44_9ACTN|nr:TetR/AcrR family transcriptional regulator [Microlunatus flavus]SEP63344.1 DNA-binding transcriptional regulator, AcrR family [Microlunatus flavus]